MRREASGREVGTCYWFLLGICVQNIGLKRLNFLQGDFIFIAPGGFHNIEVFDDETAVFNILLRKATFYQMFAPLMKQHDIVSEFFPKRLLTILSILII